MGPLGPYALLGLPPRSLRSARALHGKQTGNREAIAKIKADAAQRARNLRVIIDHVRAAGVTIVAQWLMN